MSFFTSSFSPRVYALIVSILIAALGVFVIFIRVFFTHTGDLLPEEEAVDIQLASPDMCLYSTIAADNNNAYKWALYERQKPEIIVLGSSRGLLFHQDMFSVPFLNMGRAFNYLHEGGYAVDQILRMQHKPSTIILIVDFWHFHEKSKPFFGNPRQPFRVNTLDAGAIRKLSKSFIKNSEFHQFAGGILSKPQCHIGVGAKLKKNGFGPKGFRYYGNLSNEKAGSFYDYKFQNTLNRVEKGITGFPHGENPQSAKLDYYIKQVKKIESAGIKVIALTPYLPPAVFAKMQSSGKHKYINRAFNYLNGQINDFYDFHHKSGQNNHNCDFLDGFHQGDAVNSRMLLEISKSDPVLAKKIDMEEVIYLSEKTHRALYYSSKYLGVKEPDFLGVGCKKD